MSWVDSVPGCGARQFLQSLIFSCVGFHKDFCKIKNADYFKVIASLCEDFLNLVEADTPPSPELVANLVNSMNTQLKEIIRKKEGAKNHAKFDESVTAITQILTKLSGEFQTGIRERKSQEKISVAVSSGKMRKALVDNIPKEKLLEQIELLRDVPYNDSCSSRVSRAFFKHRIASLGGLTTLVAATGSLLQTGLDIALEAISTGLNGCQRELSVSDSRVILPAFLFVMSGTMFTYALVKSKPPAPLVDLAGDQESKGEDMKEHLLSVNKSLSF